MKHVAVGLASLFVVASAFAVSSDRTGGYIHSDGQVPMNGNFRLKSFYISNDGDDEGLSVDTSGNVTLSGNLTQSGVQVSTPTAASVTNNQAITVAAPAYNLNGIGGANNTTSTVTVANGTIGTVVTFAGALATSNAVKFADSGNLYLGGDRVLDDGDTLTIRAQSATNWVEVNYSDN